MTDARCDRPGRVYLLERRVNDGRVSPKVLEAEHVGYSLAHAMWTRDDEDWRQLLDLHAAFVGEHVAMALVTDLTGDVCEFARAHHTCCTRMANKLAGRERGTVWDNGGLRVREVVGWEGVLHAIGQIALAAASETGMNDPYRCETFFGPKLWGRAKSCGRPEATSDRSIMPIEATLALVEPDVRPEHLSRGALKHEAEAAIDFELGRSELTLRPVRPFHRRKHLVGPVPPFSDDPRFIGPVDLVAPLAEEADAWLRHYNRCRDEFPTRQDVAFPAGTIRFRRLGAACDPCEPHRRAPRPPRSSPCTRPQPPVSPQTAVATCGIRGRAPPP